MKRSATGSKPSAIFTTATRTRAGVRIQRAGETNSFLIKVPAKKGHRSLLSSPKLGETLTKIFTAAVARARNEKV